MEIILSSFLYISKKNPALDSTFMQVVNVLEIDLLQNEDWGIISLS